jgi:hypothetical protein
VTAGGEDFVILRRVCVADSIDFALVVEYSFHFFHYERFVVLGASFDYVAVLFGDERSGVSYIHEH